MLSGENDDFALRAYRRILEKAGGRLIEPFEAHGLAWRTEALTCLSASAVDRAEHVIVKGTENCLVCGHGASGLHGLTITGSRNTIYLGAFCRVPKATIRMVGDDSVIVVGAFTCMRDDSSIQALGSESAVVIGERCHIGERCVIANSDGHGIYLTKDGTRINPERDVAIGDHAFIGYDSRVHKGSVVESDGIVLERSMVSGRVRAHCVYQGIPATLREEGVSWSSHVEAGTLGEAEAQDARLLEERMEFLRGKTVTGGRTDVP